MPTHAATATLTAATHGDSLSGLVAVAFVVLVIVTVGYLTVCWVSPFTRCRHTRARVWRCRRCDGTGIRLRAGRHLVNQLRDARRNIRRHR